MRVFQVLSGSASLLKWFGATTPSLLFSLELKKTKRIQLRSFNKAEVQQRTRIRFFMETTVITFEIIWHFMSCCYSVLSWVNTLSNYKRHCEKKGLCLTSSNQTYLLYGAIYSLPIVVQIKDSCLKRFEKQKKTKFIIGTVSAPV